jgi:Concanavalin A-like lectin/glucanases superfamily/WD domain, G-beta repeat
MNTLVEDQLSRWRVQQFPSLRVSVSDSDPTREQRAPAVVSGWLVAALAAFVLIGCGEDIQNPVADASAANAAAYVREVGADDPLAHWRLGEGADTIHPGAIEGDPDGAAAFDGRTSLRLVGAGNLGGPEFTVEFWERSAKGTLLGYSTLQEPEALKIHNDADLSVTVLGQTIRVKAALAVPGWHHVALSWRGGDDFLRVSIDGRAFPAQPLVTGRELPTGGTLVVGQSREDGEGRPADRLTGAVDEVVWYDRVIDPSRMLSHVLVAHRGRPPMPNTATLPIEVRGRAGPAGPVVSIEISPDGRVATLGSTDNTAGLWDLETGNFLRALTGHTDVVDSVALCPDGRLAATATGGSFDLLKDADLTVKLWDVATGRLLHDLRGHTAAVTALAFGPDGRYLASAGRDKEVRVWDTADGRLLHTLSDHADEVISVAFNRPDLLLGRLDLGSAGLRDHFKALHARRLRQAGFIGADLTRPADLPQAQVIRSRPAAVREAVDLEIALRDRQGLQSYQLYVNDVPLFEGLGKLISGRRARMREPVVLTCGTNKIEVAALNTRGQESLRAQTFEEVPGVSQRALYFLGFGVSRYKNLDRIRNLGFADKDALDLADVFSRIKGPYRDCRVRAIVNDQLTVQAVKDAK